MSRQDLQSCLVLRQVEVDRVVGHGERALLALLDAQPSDELQIGVAAAVDPDSLGSADGDAVGDLDEGLFGRDGLDLRQFVRAHRLPKDSPGVFDLADASEVRENLRTFAQFEHRSASSRVRVFSGPPAPPSFREEYTPVATRARISPPSGFLRYDCSRARHGVEEVPLCTPVKFFAISLSS